MNANKTQAFNALNKFANARVELIKELKSAGYSTVEETRPVVIEWACSKTGCAFTVKGSGRIALDSKDAHYEKTKTVVRDIMLMVQGTTRREVSAKREAFKPSREQVKAAKAFLAVLGDDIALARKVIAAL